MKNAARSVRDGWNRFWFTPTSTAPVELFRIGFGIFATLWILSLIPVMNPFFGSAAAIPTEVGSFGTWTLFALIGGSGVWVLWFVGLVGALALTVGLRTRAAAMVVFVLIMSVTRSGANAFNAGDGLVRLLALYMVLMPAGSAVSVDRWLSDRSGMWSFPRRAPWALRLVQIQVSAVYLGTMWEKSGGVLWRNGTAVAYSMKIADIVRAPAPSFLTDSVVLSQLLTYGTLAIEFAIGVLVWNKVARPVVLWLGVILHLSIEVGLDVGFFSLAMLTAYLAFVAPETATRVMRRGGDWASALWSRSRSRAAAPGTLSVPWPRRAGDRDGVGGEAVASGADAPAPVSDSESVDEAGAPTRIR